MPQEESVLTLTVGRDSHAALIDAAMRMMGARTHLLSQTTIPAKGGLSLNFKNSDISICLDGEHRFNASQVRTVWNRRFPPKFLYPSSVHPADKRHIHDNAREFALGLAEVLEDSFAVNPVARKMAGSNKLRQLQMAARLGLTIPRTLVTSDNQALQGFAAAVGRICVKPFTMGAWALDDGRVISNTSLIHEPGDLDAGDVGVVPLIYQEYMDKAYEARITVFGEMCIGCRINNQHDEEASVDWRRNQRYLQSLEPIAPPDEVALKCKALLSALGLRFGTFDFSISNQGEWCFLEVNEAGQFIWQEQFCPEICVIEPFARFLIAADPAFTWHDAPSEDFRFANLSRTANAQGDYEDLLSEEPLPPECFGLSDERNSEAA